MKNPALKTLIKDAVIIAILGCIAGAMLSWDTSLGSGASTFFWLAITGIPFGWRWANKMFVAITAKGFFIKILWAALLGCIAIFVIVIGDIIRFLKSLKETTPVE